MVSNNENDFDRSLATGEKAFASLIEDTIPVWPEMYEVLYAYQEGNNRKVISAINELKNSGNKLNSAELHQIYIDHISDRCLSDISEDISSKINDEIRNIIAAMNSAGEKSDECDSALRKIETKFSSVKTPDQLHGVVEILGNIARAMADNNNSLNTKLKRSTQQIENLHKDLNKARDESNTDALTGLANRKKFDSVIRTSIETMIENKGELCLLMVDIDHFKNFNDTYGHQTGDQILRLVAQTLKNGLKGWDLPARYGGEEFVVVLPDTKIQDAYGVAEQIRKAIAAKELIKRSTGENLGRLTVSIGLAKAAIEDSPASLIGRADKALYTAKNSGRNRCEIAPESTVEKLEQIAV